MWLSLSRICLRENVSLSRSLSSVSSSSSIQKSSRLWPTPCKAQNEASSFNSRLEDLRLSASFYGSPGPLLELPMLPRSAPMIEPHPSLPVLKGDPLQEAKDILEDPYRGPSSEIKEPGKAIKKWAHRMLRIRKRKMKVHRRKKRWRKNKVIYTSRIFNRIKSREIAFRTALLEKIRGAEAFDAEAYVKDYLQDYKTPLVPLTYEGRRHPLWLIKELLIEDELKKKRALDVQLNVLSKKPLINEGETTEDFVKRMDSELDIYKIK